MKNYPLLFLFLLLFVPTISFGAETHTLEVDFSFTAPNDQAKQLLGFHLYKEGTKVCETNIPGTSTVSCDLLTEDGTFAFTLTADYSDGSESPHSPSFPFTIISATSPPPEPPVATPEPPTAVLSSSASAGNAPLKVTFDGTSSTTTNGQIVGYNWTFGDGSQATGATTSHTFTTAGTYYTQLTVVDIQGQSDTVNTPIVVGEPALVVTEPTPIDEKPTDEIPTSGSPENVSIKIEAGEITIDHNWVTVAFEKTFSHPVVIAGPPTFNDPEPVMVRIRNLDETGFEIRLQEWDYQDDRHKMETFSYIVIEEGAYTLNNGSKLEAGHFKGSSAFGQIALQQPYTVTPVILTQVVTENETDAVTGRSNNINQYSFEYKLQEMQRTESAHIPETIGYVAWEPGKGEISGLLYEIGTTAKSVTHNWFNLNVETEFPDLPFFTAGMQTYAGSDTAVVRSRNLSTSATEIKIEEEQSTDSEVYHNKEVVGYFTIGTAVQQTSAAHSLWDDSFVPAILSASDTNAVELGVKLESTVDGFITALRFYKAAANTGTHVGNLWTASGNLLASVTFTNETASGWQEMHLPTPVAINANTTYVASYHTNVGRYSANGAYFAGSSLDNPPLRALADGENGGNGVYRYGTGGFPNQTLNASNYWVDVVFEATLGADTTAPAISATLPVDGATNVSTAPTVTVTFSEAMDEATINSTTLGLTDMSNQPVPASVAYNPATKTATLVPASVLTNSTTYTINVLGGSTGVADIAGNLLISNQSWSFTTAIRPAQTFSSLWDNSFIPAILSDSDNNAVELGVKFESSVDGFITALRFYKAAANTGTHVGNLWTANGALLASVTFTNETASGWQQMNLPTPVAINANTTYVASYHTNVGRYSTNVAYFSGTGLNNPPLRALADGENGGNGVYRYGAGGFPNQSWNASNYWVDVVFNPAE